MATDDEHDGHDHAEGEVCDAPEDEDPFEGLAKSVSAFAAGPSHPVQTKLPADAPGIFAYYTPDRTWGTAETIAALVEIGRIWSLRHDRPRVGIGDISQRGGGAISGHASHRLGVDIDLRAIRKDGSEGRLLWTDALYSRALTQELVDLFHVTGKAALKLIFFNDPNIVGVQPWPNHDNHLHARFHLAGAAPVWPLLKLGARGAAVRELQRRLGFWLRDAGADVEAPAIDGDFGGVTDGAVRAFQAAKGLTVDGEAGRNTWSALPVA